MPEVTERDRLRMLALKLRIRRREPRERRSTLRIGVACLLEALPRLDQFRSQLRVRGLGLRLQRLQRRRLQHLGRRSPCSYACVDPALAHQPSPSFFGTQAGTFLPSFIFMPIAS